MTAWPLMENDAGHLQSRTGKRLDDLTVEAARDGLLKMADIAISPETLLRQADIAEAAGRGRLAENLRRGAELAMIPEDEILAVYEMLRPGRAPDRQTLEAYADQLRKEYGAVRIAMLIEEAASVYERRDMFRKRF